MPIFILIRHKNFLISFFVARFLTFIILVLVLTKRLLQGDWLCADGLKLLYTNTSFPCPGLSPSPASESPSVTFRQDCSDTGLFFSRVNKTHLGTSTGLRNISRIDWTLNIMTYWPSGYFSKLCIILFSLLLWLKSSQLIQWNYCNGDLNARRVRFILQQPGNSKSGTGLQWTSSVLSTESFAAA